MPNIDFEKLGVDMIAALKGEFSSSWKDIKPYAEKETKAFLDNVKMIESLKLQGKISEEKAKLMMDIQKASFRNVLLTIEGLGIIAVENAINAAIGVVRGAINTALGWVIL